MHDLIIGTLSFVAGVWFGGVIMALLGVSKCNSCEDEFNQRKRNRDEFKQRGRNE